MIDIKKIFLATALFMSVGIVSGLTGYADEPLQLKAPDADLRAEADSLDIGNDVEDCYEDIERLHNDGVRLFDTAGLLTAEQKDSIEIELANVARTAGFDVAIVTATDISGYEKTQDFCESIFFYSNMGALGPDMDGTLLVMETYGDGSVYICTSGAAARYLTDAGINYIYDEVGNVGVYGSFKNGDIYDACMLYAEGIHTLYDAGIAEDQYNQDENGQTDYYYQEKKRSLNPIEAIVSAVISLLAGVLPINSIKKSYAMKDTAAATGGINKAYVTASGFAPAAAVNAVFINKKVLRTPIPVKRDNNDHHSHGGGVSSMHTGAGGHSFGGGGRGGR